MSTYRTAVEQTTTTIDARARYFRNLVVFVVLIALGSAVWAVVTWTFAAFAYLLLLVPACGFFFFLDAKFLNGWRDRLLAAWVKKEIDLHTFCDAVGTIRMLPKNTLDSMLATLPSAADFTEEQRMSATTREAIAALTTTINAFQSDALFVKAMEFSLATVSFIIAVMLRMWEPLLGLGVIPVLPLLRIWMTRRRLAKFCDQTLALRRRPDFDEKQYAKLAASLPCEKYKQEFLVTESGPIQIISS